MVAVASSSATWVPRNSYLVRSILSPPRSSLTPPLEMGSFVHAVEDEMLCQSLMPDKVPHFNAPIYLQNKSVIGKVDEILGPINEVYFSVKMGEGMVASSFKKGDKVICMLPASHTLRTGTGALAEHVRVPARYVVHKPERSSFADAAGIMLPALTARQMVAESGAKEGDRVLVNAASGGIGTMVVQMVRNVVGKSGYVVGICSGRNVEMVKGLGADEVSRSARICVVFRWN